jgi:hypothetical protein
MEMTKGAVSLVTCVNGAVVTLKPSTVPFTQITATTTVVKSTSQGSPVPTGYVVETFTVFAPMFQLNFQASDSSPSPAQQTQSSSSSSRGSGITTDPASASATPTTTADLSTGAKAGIGVGAALGILAVFLAAWYFLRARRRKKAAAAAAPGAYYVGGASWKYPEMAPQELNGHYLPSEVSASDAEVPRFELQGSNRWHDRR